MDAHAYLLAKQGNKVLSVDVSRLALERARARWGGEPGLGLAYEFGDARHLDLPAGSFDYIVSENPGGTHLAQRYASPFARGISPFGPWRAYLLYNPSRLWSGRVSAGFHLHVYTCASCAI
jgi:SAM-dependent methyltransferase